MPDVVYDRDRVRSRLTLDRDGYRSLVIQPIRTASIFDAVDDVGNVPESEPARRLRKPIDLAAERIRVGKLAFGVDDGGFSTLHLICPSPDRYWLRLRHSQDR